MHALSDGDIGLTEHGTLHLRNRLAPVQLVMPNPYVNYSSRADPVVHSIVDHDYGGKTRVNPEHGRFRKRADLTLLLVTVSADVAHPVGRLSATLERATTDAAAAVGGAARVRLARVEVDKAPRTRAMLQRALGPDVALLPVLLLFDDGVARRAPVYKPAAQAERGPDVAAITAALRGALSAF